MNKAIVITQYGDSSVLQWQDYTLPALKDGDVLVRNTVAGFNMIDTYMRKGLYPVKFPAVLGVEGAGIVEEVGAAVNGLSVGDRVVYLGGGTGSYSEHSVVVASSLVVIPDDISDEIAAACYLKGLTVWALLNGSYKVMPGDNVLIYAAAGGVGSLMCQWAKKIGARVIGIVGSQEKVELAKSYGCDEVINRSSQDILHTVKELTQGEGVQVVYDSLGADTFETSLDCLAPLGTMVSFGNATGAVPPFSILTLAAKGSLKLVRPQVHAYISKRDDLENASATLFNMIRNNDLNVEITQRFPVSQAARAHDTVESQKTTGATVLIV